MKVILIKGVECVQCLENASCLERNKVEDDCYGTGIVVYPVGEVASIVSNTDDMTATGCQAHIQIKPEYLPALYRIQEYSHLWVLCWFDQSRRDILQARPSRMDPALPHYGVFALRTPVRPNPIALTLVRLVRVDRNELYVTGLDAVQGTPVLDIKPYFEPDIVFSPVTPYVRPIDLAMRKAFFYKQAMQHHGEACADLELGVRMALLADKHFGQIQARDLLLLVNGPPCLADVLQGLTRARVANPPRFIWSKEGKCISVLWTKGSKKMWMVVRRQFSLEQIQTLSDEELLAVSTTG